LNFKFAILKSIKLFLLLYGIAIVLLTGILFVFVLMSDFGKESNINIVFQMLSTLFKYPLTYVILLSPYLLFLLIRTLIRDYKQHKIYGLCRGIILKSILPAALIWGSIQLVNKYRQIENYNYKWDYSIENKSDRIRNLYQKDKKQRGIHFFGASKDSLAFEILKTNNFEWLTIVPFLSQEHHDKPALGRGFRTNDSTPKHQRWHRLIQASDNYGFKIMLKPHIWLHNTSKGIWRSNIKMDSQKDWDIWFNEYSRYILDYARFAEELDIALFCIGTELHTTAKEQPEKWRQLIKDVRSVYSGKLTYGANWDTELFDIPFWEDLDFIGVQAYFPIAENNNPDLAELEEGWEKHFKTLEKLHKTYNKPILFTELGYKSTADAGIKPWEWNTLSNQFYKKISKRTQALCYEAFFKTVWQQDWFEGAHLWEWQSRSRNGDGNNNAFTIQHKPALNVVAKGFGNITK